MMQAMILIPVKILKLMKYPLLQMNKPQAYHFMNKPQAYHFFILIYVLHFNTSRNFQLFLRKMIFDFDFLRISESRIKLSRAPIISIQLPGNNLEQGFQNNVKDQGKIDRPPPSREEQEICWGWGAIIYGVAGT